MTESVGFGTTTCRRLVASCRLHFEAQRNAKKASKHRNSAVCSSNCTFLHELSSFIPRHVGDCFLFPRTTKKNIRTILHTHTHTHTQCAKHSLAKVLKPVYKLSWSQKCAKNFNIERTNDCTIACTLTDTNAFFFSRSRKFKQKMRNCVFL